MFWVRERKEKKKTKMAKVSRIFTGAFALCLDTNDEYDTRREKMDMFPLGITGMMVSFQSNVLVVLVQWGVK